MVGLASQKGFAMRTAAPIQIGKASNSRGFCSATQRKDERCHRGRRGALTFLSALILVAPVAHAATICVNQGGTGGCFGTIFDALNAASNNDTILIAGAPSPYFERLTITKSVSLIGDSAATTIVDGGFSGQVIRILSAVTVTLANLTIRNGQAGEGDFPDQWGGGIHNVTGILTLNNVIVTGNRTGGGNGCCGGAGGGISSDLGTLTLINSNVSGNVTGRPTDNPAPGGIGGSGGPGGGIYSSNGTLTLNNSTVSNNTTGNGANGGFEGGVGGPGGGICIAGGTLTVNASTVSGNMTGVAGTGGTVKGSSGNGAGIFLSAGTSTIINSTLSGNLTGLGTSATSGDGGGIYSSSLATVNVTYSTLAFNQVGDLQTGGAIANSGGTVNLKDSLVAYNTTQQGITFLHDCSGTITSLGYNVMTEPDCTITPTTGDQFYVRGTILGPLQNNGGPTQTHALVAGSPAIDAADNSTCPSTDQRGKHRPEFGGIALRCDIGSFEVQTPANFYTLTPCRVLDTRSAAGPYGGPALSAQATRLFTLAGQCGIPADAKVVSLNVTVTNGTSLGDLRLFPGSSTPPLASTINFRAGQTRANNALVTLSATGILSVLDDQPTGQVQLIVDTNGYFKY
jgi:hypothetical protein